jgi:hypothetical protein
VGAPQSKALGGVQIPPPASNRPLLRRFLLHRPTSGYRSQHGEEQEKRKDALRTAYLAQHGYRVIRFSNEQVSTDLEDVLQAIYEALNNS